MSNLPELMERLEKEAKYVLELRDASYPYAKLSMQTTNTKPTESPAAILELITALRESVRRDGELMELVRGYRKSSLDHDECQVRWSCLLCKRADELLAPTVPLTEKEEKENGGSSK